MTLHFINLYDYIKKNPIAQLCLHSWKTLMPELEIKIWTEKDEFIQKILNEDSVFMNTWRAEKNKSEWIDDGLDLGNICDYLRLNVQYEYGGLYAELDEILIEPFKIDENLEFCLAINVNQIKTISTSDGPCYFKKYNQIVYNVIQNIKNNFNYKQFLYNNEMSFCAIPSNTPLSDILKLSCNTSIYKIKFLHLCDFFMNEHIYLFDDNTKIEDKVFIKDKAINKVTFLMKFTNDKSVGHRINYCNIQEIGPKYHIIYKIFFNMLYNLSTEKMFSDNIGILDGKDYSANDLIKEWDRIQEKQEKITLHFINLYNYIEKNPIAKLCIHSWKTLMPELNIKIWTEKDEYIQKLLNEKNKFTEEFSNKNIDLGHLCDYLRLNIQYEFGGIYAELDHILMAPIKINGEFCNSFNYKFFNNNKTISTSKGPTYFKKNNKVLKSVIDNIKQNFNVKEFLDDFENTFCKIPDKILSKNYTKDLIQNSKLTNIDFMHLASWFNTISVFYIDSSDTSLLDVDLPGPWIKFYFNEDLKKFFDPFGIPIKYEYFSLYKIFINIIEKDRKNYKAYDSMHILDGKTYTVDDLITEWNKLQGISQ